MHLGLRAKSALAVLVSILLIVVLAGTIGWWALRYVKTNLGEGFIGNVTRLNKQRILTEVLRELALSRQLAASEVTRRWILQEDDARARQLFFTEAAHYQKSFADHSYFLITRDTRHYYFNDNKSTFSDRPRYFLYKNDPNDAWFFNTMASDATFNINVNYDVNLKVTKLWINVLVKDENRNIGLAGTGLSLSSFLKQFINDNEPGVTPFIINNEGAIQAFPDPELIDYSSIGNKGEPRKTVFQLLKDSDSIQAMRTAMRAASKDEESTPLFWASLDGTPQLFAVAYVPEVQWFVVTAADLDTAQILDRRTLAALLAGGVVLLLLLMLMVTVTVNRVLLRPLLKLTDSAQAVALGNYDVQLPPAGNDELGALTRAFGDMAQQVRSHTDELENRVAERTRDLQEANQKVDDSIQYARLIQHAILPEREMREALGEKYFVLWQPRDVVGGDFYIFRRSEYGCLIGVADCAGHGVPGAFMTMIAHSVLDVAVETRGLEDPAALLEEMDTRISALLREDLHELPVATHLDAGLAYIDFEQRQVTYSGAKIALYLCSENRARELKGNRQSIGGRKKTSFVNYQQTFDADTTFYLTTDGLLDQAGGELGYGFGRKRFLQFIETHSNQPFPQQQEALIVTLSQYQGTLPQRDDITVMSFRFNLRREN